ncbi:hypothetical protein L9G15_06440 [Shewanella sp. A3A]|uniref:Uncharacterized protein n=1 Tax=Shewanella electrica TaxID=515560 RepID=A0ABT2FQF3_9GAMM|nr:hypothetical protein [Shewanella electrica]MCH1919071.1 hypothetical protein [Shewanella ferrihydritica]MCH1926941.1 hypothetical protein [Shewanella electrica]MCS4558562.1 hypothetical protein [Shewanella electrica]
MKAYQGGWVTALFDAATAPVEPKAKKDTAQSQRRQPAMTSKKLKHA